MKIAVKNYEKIKFLHLITGKKTFPKAWLNLLPETTAYQVLKRQR